MMMITTTTMIPIRYKYFHGKKVFYSFHERLITIYYIRLNFWDKDLLAWVPDISSVVAIERGAFGSPSAMVTNLSYLHY